jgi:hypothetical protein
MPEVFSQEEVAQFFVSLLPLLQQSQQVSSPVDTTPQVGNWRANRGLGRRRAFQQRQHDRAGVVGSRSGESNEELRCHHAFIVVPRQHRALPAFDGEARCGSLQRQFQSRAEPTRARRGVEAARRDSKRSSVHWTLCWRRRKLSY